MFHILCIRQLYSRGIFENYFFTIGSLAKSYELRNFKTFNYFSKGTIHNQEKVVKTNFFLVFMVFLVFFMDVLKLNISLKRATYSEHC